VLVRYEMRCIVSILLVASQFRIGSLLSLALLYADTQLKHVHTVAKLTKYQPPVELAFLACVTLY
jgi:hypothetical protein